MKEIEVYFPESDIRVTAALYEEQEPELSAQIWEYVKEPVRMACHHTMSTGDVFVAFPRPPKHPPVTGTQANPIGRVETLWSEMEIGEIFWRGWNCGICYGKCTEPLNPGGSVAARVIDADIEKFIEACKEVWNCSYFKHCISSVVLSRKEC